MASMPRQSRDTPCSTHRRRWTYPQPHASEVHLRRRRTRVRPWSCRTRGATDCTTCTGHDARGARALTEPVSRIGIDLAEKLVEVLKLRRVVAREQNERLMSAVMGQSSQLRARTLQPPCSVLKTRYPTRL